MSWPINILQHPAPSVANDSTSAALAWTTPTLPNSTLVAFVAMNENAGDVTVTGPAGWTAVQNANSTGNCRSYCFKIERSPSRSGTETFTLSAARDCVLHLIELSDGAVDVNTTSSGSSATADSGTTAAVNQPAEFFLVHLVNQNTATQSAPTYALLDAAHTSNATAAKQVESDVYFSSSTSGGTADGSSTLSASQPWAGQVLALRISLAVTFGASIFKTLTKTVSFGAKTWRQKQVTFGATIVDNRGSYRGVFQTSDRDAITNKYAKDTAHVSDTAAPVHYYTGSAWLTGHMQQSPEAGVTRLGMEPTTAGWRLERGDPTYPLRFWDGTTTRFSLDNTGAVVARTVDIYSYDLNSTALKIHILAGSHTVDIMQVISDTDGTIKGGISPGAAIFGIGAGPGFEQGVQAHRNTDVQSRVGLDGWNGGVWWSDGAGANDVKLIRTAAGTITLNPGVLVLAGGSPGADRRFTFFMGN